MKGVNDESDCCVYRHERQHPKESFKLDNWRLGAAGTVSYSIELSVDEPQADEDRADTDTAEIPFFENFERLSLEAGRRCRDLVEEQGGRAAFSRGRRSRPRNIS